MKILVTLVIAVLLAGCGSSRSNLTIINGTDEPISSIQVAAGGDVWFLNDIEAGQATKFIAKVSGDGGPRITWKWRDGLYAGDACYYSAGFGYGLGPEGRVRVTGEELEIVRCGREAKR